MAISTRTLGAHGPRVSALGLGLMGMSDLYGPADDDESVATIRAALDAEVTLMDTGDFYGSGHNEMLLRRAIGDGRREQVVVSVKFGVLRDPAGGWNGIDTRPAAVKSALAYTLRRLGTDHVDIYRPARLDPAVPIEETVGAIAEMIQAGYVRHLGLSEVGAQTLRRAHAVHPVSDVQIEYSLISRGVERELLPVARELGVGITAYGVLSRGLISGHWNPQRTDVDFRSSLPRFSGENVSHNLALVDALRDVAESQAATVAQVAIAWVLARGDHVVPLVGARRRDRLAESLGAAELRLDESALAAIDAAVPAASAAGDRYSPAQMALLDSEKVTGDRG